MKNILLIISFLLSTVCYGQQTEQINPADPNYNVELNAILQTINANNTTNQNNISTVQGYFSSGILAAASGGTGQNSSAWTSGDIVYMSSTGVWGHEALPNGKMIFTSSGTFTAPAGVSIVMLTMLGGGGGGAGGGGCGNNFYGNGASAGSYVTNYPYPVIAGNSYTVTINTSSCGGGGGGGTFNTAGGNGQTGCTVVFDALTMPGGAGGVGGNSSVASSAGGFNASTVTAGNSFLPGGPGGASTMSASGAGGGIFGGVPGTSVSGTSTGVNATGYGAGGSGGSIGQACGGSSGYAGGNGAPGIVIVQY